MCIINIRTDGKFQGGTEPAFRPDDLYLIIKEVTLSGQNQSKRWVVQPKIDANTEKALESYPPYMRQILFNRGIRSPEEAEEYLNAASMLADPFRLLDMEKAVDRLLLARDQGEPIVVYGDYDVDGVTATVMMVEVLRFLGAKVTRYIPNRFEEGYGLNPEAVRLLADSGTKVILTVDCGIRSPREAELARSLGVDLIISDHHQPKDELQGAYAVICPKRENDPYPDKDLAGVGVAYKIVQGLLQRAGVKDRNAEEWLDLVALGTVADIVPLTGENRVMVRRGINLLRLGKRPGLKALAGVAGKNFQQVNAADIGFIIGPRLNAAGRMESALQAYELLISDSIENVGKSAQILENQNYERQKATRKAQEKVQQDLIDPSSLNIITAFDPEFSSGIVGLVASKLAENFYRPAVVGQIENDHIRASCRSIPEFHITKALDECADLLIRHGGHAMAAGFTVSLDNSVQLVERLRSIAARELSGLDLRPVLKADIDLDIGSVKPSIYSQLEQLQPTGMGNPAALLISRGVEIDGMKIMGKESTHISFSVRGSKINRAVAFNQAQWYEVWQQERPKFDIAYSIEVNRFFDMESLQLNIRDMKISGRSG
jgi:single-stranded-DNA-specific exonuclease